MLVTNRIIYIFKIQQCDHLKKNNTFNSSFEQNGKVMELHINWCSKFQLAKPALPLIHCICLNVHGWVRD